MSSESTKSSLTQGEPILVAVSTERWSDFFLEDGTLIRAKVTLSHAIRLPQLDDKGNQMYEISGQTTIVTIQHRSSKEGQLS